MIQEYLDAVLVLAQQSGCSAYDCEFIALAQSEGTHLITTDRKLLRRFPETAMTATAYLRQHASD